jgi:hypothetical protein
MPDDDAPLKSAYELAMERLRAKDRKAGIEESKPLTSAQKERIAELRQEARAKLAELEIMRRDKLAETQGDPEKIAEVEEHFQVDRRRVESARDEKIAAVRRGED